MLNGPHVSRSLSNRESVCKAGGGHSVLAFRPAAMGSILCVPDFFQKKNSTLPRFIHESLPREGAVQSLIADQTHLVLVSGKLILQKVFETRPEEAYIAKESAQNTSQS